MKLGRLDGIELIAFVDKIDLSAGTEGVFCMGFVIHLNAALNRYVQYVSRSLPAPLCSHTRSPPLSLWLHNVITFLTLVIILR